MTKFFDAVQEGGMATNETNAAVANFATVPKTFDYSYIFIVIMLTGVLLVTSFMIPSHPVFMIVNIIGIFFMVVLSMAISNMYGAIITSDELVATSETFTMTNFAMNYLPYICIAVIVLTTIVMFAKGRSGDYGQ
jgi:glucan phosphoethanolaminetransferase (alkaline phosphatase superfamily)